MPEEDVAQEPTLVAEGTTSPATLDTAGEPPTLQKYALGTLLGKGGMGEVVLAHDARIGRDVALKRMRSEHPTEEAVARFLREAKIQARLDHPAIVPVHELGTDREGRPYFTMKRLAGTTLSANLDTAKPQRLLRAFVDVCHAVDLAHSRRVVHRDLKPSNIMLGDYGEVYVLDWGVARVLDSADADGPASDIPSLGGETQTGDLLGTPGYMAPEQVRGGDVGPAADVYALGSILFEILAREPLHPRGQAAIASTLSGTIVTSPSRRRPERGVAPELDELCVEALAEQPDARPTARALGDRVQQYLDGDRDLDRRRTLATELVEAGRAALARGDRAEAVRLGGRALALAPELTSASELVYSLVLEPPAEVPPEVRPLLAREEMEARKQRSRRAIAPYLAPFAFAPFLGHVDIASWPILIALYAMCATMSLIAFINARTARIPVWLYLTAHLAMITLFTQISGPFVLAPLLLGAVLLAVTPIPWVNERRWFVVAWTSLAVLLPFALEAVGALPATWSMSDDGVVSRGSIFSDRDSITPLFVGNLLLAIVVALYARAISRDRRIALQRLHVQAWHFQQLLPR